MLPNADNAIIPIDKLVNYALNPNVQPDKARVFELALGYNLTNYEELLDQIYGNLKNFEAEPRGNKGFGETYRIVMELTGKNKKTAKVLTGWIDDVSNGEMRLTTIYIDD